MKLSQAPSFVISKPEAVPEVPAEQLVDGVLELVFVFVGSIALLVLVIQGVRFALSAGDIKKANSARDGIIYSLVGSLICFTAWSLVHFTLNRVLRAETLEPRAESIAVLLGDIAGLLIFVGGVVSVIMVLVGATKIVLSSGNSEQANSGRNTIIYAIVGLLVCMIAGPLLHQLYQQL